MGQEFTLADPFSFLGNSRDALYELAVQATVTVVFLYLLRKKIRRWWIRLFEGTHSKMLGVVDLTQTIVEDGVLKVRTGRPMTMADYTLRDESLTEIFTDAVEHSYATQSIFVTIPADEGVAFKKLKTSSSATNGPRAGSGLGTFQATGQSPRNG